MKLRPRFTPLLALLWAIVQAGPTAHAQYQVRTAPRNPPKPVKLTTRPAIPPQRNLRARPESLGVLLGTRPKATLAEIEPFIQGDPNRRDEVMRFETLLLRAIWWRREDVARVLIARGADVNATGDQKDWSPLKAAMSRGLSLSFVKFLMEKGARFHPESEEKHLLHYAADGGNVELARFLLTKGYDVHRVRPREGTPLESAIESIEIPMARFLIQQGSQVNRRDESKRTPLHRAAAKGDPKMIGLLLENGAEVNARDKYGRTSLTLALDYGYKEAAEVLKRHGATE